MIFVWAFSDSSKPSKSNYFKATLIFALIMIAIQILLLVLFGSSLLSLALAGY
jgi:hypothetical protein